MNTSQMDVVINDEEQYSIWPSDSQPPDGWYRVGFTGNQEACLAHIETVWTDMRPRSLRESYRNKGGRND